MSVELISKVQTDWENMGMGDLKKKYEHMAERLEARRETCRKSSKQYYDKTFKLSSTPTAEQIEKNKIALSKRDVYQQDYYNKNKEQIRIKQKAYRERKKADKKAKLEVN
tara:strand:- start:903 stop:1232 length:330 start_codon:yes stop_codon:yes gene_type:complete